MPNENREIELYQELNKLTNTWYEIESIEQIEDYLKDTNNPNYDEVVDLYNELVGNDYL